MLRRVARLTPALALLVCCAWSACAHIAPAPTSTPQRTVAIRLVHPAGAQVDVKAAVLRSRELRPIVEGLAPGEAVIFRARDGDGTSWAAFTADERGLVDLSTATPAKGSWAGADSRAWAWSMSPVPTRPRGETTTTFSVERVDGTVLETLAVRRTDTAPGLRIVRVDEGGVLGDFVSPEGTGPFPAIVVLGGSEGGNGPSVRRALDLASEGFACLALSYFGDGALEPTIMAIPIERVQKGIAWLRAQPNVDAARLGILGDSRGGELALIAAERLEDVRAVAAIVPSGLRWGAMSNPNEPAWTWEGKPLPFVPWSGEMPEVVQDRGAVAVTTLRVFTTSLAQATAGELDVATIHAERAPGPVLLIAAADDRLWPSCALAAVAYERLGKMGHRDRFGDAFHCLPEAGHRIGVPGGSTMEHAAEVGGATVIVKGGTPRGAASAEWETRALLLEHFQRALRSGSVP